MSVLVKGKFLQQQKKKKENISNLHTQQLRAYLYIFKWNIPVFK